MTDDERLAAVEVSASACPDACAADVVSLIAEVRRLRGQAQIVTRIWDMLARCEDEFGVDPPSCAEYEDRLDDAILGLMQLADRERWEVREREMGAARKSAIDKLSAPDRSR